MEQASIVIVVVGILLAIGYLALHKATTQRLEDKLNAVVAKGEAQSSLLSSLATSLGTHGVTLARVEGAVNTVLDKTSNAITSAEQSKFGQQVESAVADAKAAYERAAAIANALKPADAVSTTAVPAATVAGPTA